VSFRVQPLQTPLIPVLAAMPPPVDASVITLFQAGHGFAASPGSTGTQGDDASTFLLGTQSYRLTTAGAGGFTAARRTGFGPFDATGRMMAMLVRIDNWQSLSDCRLDIASDVFVNWSSADTVSPATNLISPFYVNGEWLYVTLNWGAFAIGGGAGVTRNNITGVQVRCKDDGTGQVVEHVNKVAMIAEPANGVVTFTFDDGYAGVWASAKPILDAAGYSAGFGPIVDKIGQTNFMPIDQLYGLRDSGWEPHPHSFAVAVHNNYSTVSDQTAIADMTAAKAWIRANGFGSGDNLLVPQGQTINATRYEAFRNMATTCRSAYTRVRETYPPGPPYDLRTYTLSQANTLADVELKVDECATNKTWLILQAHNITATPTSIDWTVADFQSLVTYIQGKGAAIKVKRITDVVKSGVA